MAHSVATNSLDCYFVLGVRIDATFEEIEAAYRKALESLPARGFARWFASFWYGRNAESIRYAYQTLADPVARESYDAWLRKKCALSFSLPF
jgi:DnaJ-class molecular chaperone